MQKGCGTYEIFVQKRKSHSSDDADLADSVFLQSKKKKKVHFPQD